MTDPSEIRIVSGMAGRVLDSSGLVELARGRSFFAQTWVSWSLTAAVPWAVPTTALAEAWAVLPDKGRLALAVLVQFGHVVVEPLDVERAGTVGEMLESAEGRADVCTAHVAEIAVRRGWPVLTDRGSALRAIVPGLEIEPLP